MTSRPEPSSTAKAEHERPSSQRERKSKTCLRWFEDKCTLSEDKCYDAHHFFPIVAERNTSNGHNRLSCFFGTNCRWPGDTCGYSHDDMVVRKPSLSPSDTRDIGRSKSTIHVDEIVDLRPWYARLMYICKNCEAFFSEQDHVTAHSKHCRSSETERGQKQETGHVVTGANAIGAHAMPPPARPSRDIPGPFKPPQVPSAKHASGGASKKINRNIHGNWLNQRESQGRSGLDTRDRALEIGEGRRASMPSTRETVSGALHREQGSIPAQEFGKDEQDRRDASVEERGIQGVKDVTDNGYDNTTYSRSNNLYLTTNKN
ncbi:hypothetical protein LTR37_011384 [Vermiconidia calcicola]|uniref:Uncharacterized protein n=1 Tax=Vermiconidia calcicola TaxID=1690605 RepID=A0ACC3N2X0_9PEZI|nr:hypothetical protein LTR37_011384 [Vermiconidia calcicola]